MKKIIALMLAMTLLMSLFPAFNVVGAGDEESYLFKHDFEEQKPGTKKIDALNDVYKEVASITNPNTFWNGAEGVYEVVKESDLSDNQVLRCFNNTKMSSVTTFTKSLRTNPDDSGVRCFDLSFRLKSNGQSCSVAMSTYGSNIGTMRPFTLSGVNASCMGVNGASLEMDKWNNVRIRVDFDSNLIDLFINNIPEYTGSIWPEDEIRTLPNMLVISFSSTVTGDKECFWDDIKICEAVGAQQEAVDDKFDLYKGVHPRIFTDSTDFERIKKLTQDERFKGEWDAMIAMCDRFLESGPTQYWVDTDDEENWMRDFADWMLNLCIVAKVTGEEKYRELLRDCIKTIMEYPQWGRGGFLNSDLAATHVLTLTSIYYDWFYDDLQPNEKYLIINTVSERASQMAKLGWWRIKYLQNHMWNCASALMTTAAAFYEDIPEAKGWAFKAKHLYDTIFTYLGDDGASHEGLMYWGYGLRFLEYYIENAEKFLGVDYSELEYIKNASKYFAEMYVETNDVPLSNVRFSDYSPVLEPVQVGNLMYLAQRNRDPVTMWYVNYLREKFTELERKEFYTFAFFLFYDDTIVPKSPQEVNYPEVNYFHDLELLFMRTNRLTEDETVIAYRCGSTVGKGALGAPLNDDIGSDHVHNDVNSMQIITRGENLLSETTYGGRGTESHNTIMVNGKGQIIDLYNNGEVAKTRMQQADPKITKIEETENYVYSIGDGTNVYDKDITGLLKFKRHFLYLKPDILLVVDDIETEVRDEKIPVEIRYFPQKQDYKASRDGGYTFIHDNYNFIIKPLETGNGIAEATKVEKSDSGSSSYQATVVRIINEDNKIIQPVAMSWSDPDRKPADVTARTRENGTVEFYIENKIVSLDTINDAVSISEVESDVYVKIDGELKNGAEGEFAMKDNRFYLSSAQLSHYFGITVNEKDGKYVYRYGNKNAYAQADSNVITVNNKEIKCDTPFYVENGELYTPVRFILQAFNIDCSYDSQTKTLSATTNVDFTDTTLYSLMVNGFFVPVEKGQTEFSIPVFGTAVDIQAIPNNESANVAVNACEGVFGNSEFTITSADGTKSQTYKVETIPYTDICGTTIYNFAVSAHDGNAGENAFDKKIGSRWSAAGEQWIWYDLGEVKEIDNVQIAFYRGNTRTTEFYIEVSEDCKNWTEAGHFVSSGETENLEKFALQNAKGRYIRYRGFGAKGSGFNSLLEMGIELKQ